jgi:hypothetical protein
MLLGGWSCSSSAASPMKLRFDGLPQDKNHFDTDYEIATELPWDGGRVVREPCSISPSTPPAMSTLPAEGRGLPERPREGRELGRERTAGMSG